MDNGSLVEVLFRHHEHPGRMVAVRGDFSSWRVSHPLLEQGPGEYSGSVALRAGIYRYKLLVDGQLWMRDQSNPWIDDADGFGNSILVVGGTEPPLFFAPCRRCWVLTDGHLTVHAEVAAGARVPEMVNLVDLNGQVVASHPLSRYWQAANLLLLRYHGRVPSAAVAAAFSGYPGSWALPIPTAHRRPAWLVQSTIYSIFLDRWHRGIHALGDSRAASRRSPSTAEVHYGGDLAGVRESLHHIAGLGADAICLTPLHPAESPHRYDPKSFAEVDARLGGEHALIELVQACHAHGLRLVLDAAFTHCHVSHAAFRDLLEQQAESRYCDWFHVEHFPVTLDDPTSYRHYPRFPDQPLLNLRAASVIEHFKQIIERWMQLGVDGIRFDAVAYGPPETWHELVACARAHNPEVAIIVECVSDSPLWAHEWLSAHSATDYSSYDLLVRTLGLGLLATEHHCCLERLQQHRLGPELDQLGLRFIDTYDTDRFLTRCGSQARLRAALVYLLLRPEPVLFLYGTEFAVSSHVATHEFDSPWPDRLPMPALQTESEFLALVRVLIEKRQTLRNQGFGAAYPLDTPRGIIGYERVGRGGTIRVFVNATDEPREVGSCMDGGTVLVDTGLGATVGVVEACSAMAILRPDVGPAATATGYGVLE